MPGHYAKLQIACTTLGVDMPDFFLQQNPSVNAFTGGVEKPVIVLHTGLIERLSDEELLAVIAHEVGHIHAEHVFVSDGARLIEALTNALSPFDSGSEIVKVFDSRRHQSARLLAWARKRELSCDRAALLSRKTRT
jgi:Zn-dependent protease with chaperone function